MERSEYKDHLVRNTEVDALAHSAGLWIRSRHRANPWIRSRLETLINGNHSRRNLTKGIGMRVHIGAAQDVDQLAVRAKAAGISLDADPHDTPWNSRTFEVTDPSGFKLSISSEV